MRSQVLICLICLDLTTPPHPAHRYGDDTGYAYGKRQRLRDAGLWLVDPPAYYEQGRYLQLVSGLATQHSPQSASLLDPKVRSRGIRLVTVRDRVG